MKFSTKDFFSQWKVQRSHVNVLNEAVQTFGTNPVEFQLMSLNSEDHIIIKRGQGVGTRGYKITKFR